MSYDEKDRKNLLVTEELHEKAIPEAQKGQRSVSDIIIECQENARKMSATNPNKLLLLNCAFALRQLVDRLAFHEDKTRVS